jgi:hypothetical protein
MIVRICFPWRWGTSCLAQWLLTSHGLCFIEFGLVFVHQAYFRLWYIVLRAGLRGRSAGQLPGSLKYHCNKSEIWCQLTLVCTYDFVRNWQSVNVNRKLSFPCPQLNKCWIKSLRISAWRGAKLLACVGHLHVFGPGSAEFILTSHIIWSNIKTWRNI